MRGSRRDVDRWDAAAAHGWSFDAVRPYFLKSEDWTGRPHSSHGRGGPMTISPMREAHPLCREFLSACHEAGIPLLADYHGGDMEGALLPEVGRGSCRARVCQLGQLSLGAGAINKK